MAAIASVPFTHLPVDGRFWPELMRTIVRWTAGRRLPVRDAIVLLPTPALLPLARAAAAQAGGWIPRIETVHTLAAALGPPAPAGEGPSGDVVRDRLAAAALLRAQASWATWSRRDPRSFSQAVGRVVDTAHELMHTLQAEPPGERSAWTARAREALSPVAGPGATERALARIALEWAALADFSAVDRVHALAPSAWIVLRCGGAQRLADSVLRAGSAPGLLIDADGREDEAVGLAPSRLLCEGLEDEAQAATDAVLRALDEGRAPVALVAQDRLLVRRVRALLDRFELRLRDETGWTLSTTRRAAHLMAMLRAAGHLHELVGGRPGGSAADRFLDWMKGDPAVDPTALASLERAWRRGGVPEGAALALLQTACERLQPLAKPATRSLAAWLATLATVLKSGPDWAALQDDPAGAQICAVLRLNDTAASEDWQALTQASRVDLDAFRDWVDEVLEQQNFVPPSDDGEVDVIVTPAGRSLLRPFAAVVFPGTDERRLGASGQPSPLLPDAIAAALGMETAAGGREREALVLRQLLRVQPLLLLRRGSEDGEALAASPLVERALRALQGQGIAVAEEQRAVPTLRRIAARPVYRPAPAAPQALPAQLSASSVQALRDCPYRFYARSVLRLGEAEELDVELDKRDYGNWLHAVLLQFHRERDRPRATGDEIAALQRAADTQEQALAMSAQELLPFRAAFAAWAPAYVAWLHARDAQGWNWQDGEAWHETHPPELPGLRLHGRIDRIDRRDRDASGEAVVELIDYKTGSAAALRQRVREPLEDTQLAFYAALLAGTPLALRAAYVVLDEREGPIELEHRDVQASAQALLEGLAGEFRRLRAGAGLPALGEGAVCESCEARGLCRRDDWGSA